MVIDERAEREYLKQFDTSPAARSRYRAAKADYEMARRIQRAVADGLLPGVTPEEAAANRAGAARTLNTVAWKCDEQGGYE